MFQLKAKLELLEVYITNTIYHMRMETKYIKKAWYVLVYRFQEASKGLN